MVPPEAPPAGTTRRTPLALPLALPARCCTLRDGGYAETGLPQHWRRHGRHRIERAVHLVRSGP